MTILEAIEEAIYYLDEAIDSGISRSLYDRINDLMKKTRRMIRKFLRRYIDKPIAGILPYLILARMTLEIVASVIRGRLRRIN